MPTICDVAGWEHVKAIDISYVHAHVSLHPTAWMADTLATASAHQESQTQCTLDNLTRWAIV